MSIETDRAGADAILQAAGANMSEDELSDVDVNGDGSSSLSDIEDKDEPEQDADGSDEELSNVSDAENDSEAETERLEESPNKIRTQQDVVLSSQNGAQVYNQSPSKLHNQIIPEDQDEEEDDDQLSDDEISLKESPKSSLHEDPEPTTAATSLEDSAGEGKQLLSTIDPDTRKRKRSIMAGSGLADDDDGPLRKRTGSIMAPADEYAVEDDEHPEEEEEADTSNPHSGNISGDEEREEQEDGAPHEAEQPIAAEEGAPEAVEISASPKRRGRKKKKVVENGASREEEVGAIADGDDDAAVNGEDEVRNGEEEGAENGGDDETEALQKNEEELERKRIALDQLGAIEKKFATFRDRLYDERLEQLNREEAMLRQDKPTHPGYLAMIQCIDARRDEKVRISERLREFELETLKNYAVARRSQILVQFQQEVRDVREKKLEQLGKQWYEIQHDRRSYAGSVPDYALKFPTRRSQQVSNQVAYSNEVSILSGVAKYVGFPAAPPMASTTAEELDEDLAKMGAVPVPALPLHELAALRNVSSTSRFKPAEEQFIEQTPWANPQHPAHAHLIQRQTSAQTVQRTTSPFSQTQAQPRRHSQHGSGGPISGTFSNSSSSLPQHTNGLSMSGGRISPHNPFASSNYSHTIAPSPLGSRQTSLSPQPNRPSQTLPVQQHGQPSVEVKPNGNQQSPSATISGLHAIPRDYPQEVRREQGSALIGRF
ncbi:hypothetical protein D0Z07_5729 [Hyphodiscus hymeniophilus]|uniref:Transcriptional regulatory protein DEP1 n=1 Tax=Hyphodiscus hymeniophilus TaxID=353542 RepID=A0A9P6VHJ7_9HELO|nr:hypothetical protein D0Z07_5729 [Hyphodiscus hymeniophilus]